MCELKSHGLIIKLRWPREEFPLRLVLKVKTPASVCVFDDSTTFPSVALGADLAGDWRGGRRRWAASERGNDGEFLDLDRQQEISGSSWLVFKEL